MLFGFIMIRYWRKHPGNGSGFGRSRGQEFFDQMKRRFDERQQRHTTSNRRRWVDETDDEPQKPPSSPVPIRQRLTPSSTRSARAVMTA